MLMSMELNDIIKTSESINIYNNGEILSCGRKEVPYSQIISGWIEMTENSHEMPAYGVSLNRETVEAMNSGLWVEFVFNSQMWYNEMPFEKLLVTVEKQWQGFNIIRYNSKGGYDGRCYYIDLVGKNMAKFYDILANI